MSDPDSQTLDRTNKSSRIAMDKEDSLRVSKEDTSASQEFSRTQPDYSGLLDKMADHKKNSGSSGKKSQQETNEAKGIEKIEKGETKDILLDEEDLREGGFRNFAQSFLGFKLRPTKNSETQLQDENKTDNPFFMFGPRKKVKNPYEPPTTKYSKPKKVDQIDVDPHSNDPMKFVLKVFCGKSRHTRGYITKVEPLPFDTPKPADHTRFVCISDTHNEHSHVELPEGDVLLHCGDFTLSGKLSEVDDFNNWLGKLPFQHKIVIAGNHELSFDPKIMEGVKKSKEKNEFNRWGSYLNPIEEKDWRSITSRLTNCTYLEDSGVTINGIKIWGSPWQPEFGGWGFNLPRGKEILEKWNQIPGDGIDILLTHGPPAGHGDKVMSGSSVGCVDLLNTIQFRVQPKYHLFGHIHEAYGITTDRFTTYINCCSVNYRYQPVHKPIIFDLLNKDA